MIYSPRWTGWSPRRLRRWFFRPTDPLTIRHTTAMSLLQARVDISVIALWLGHESPTTTHQYVEADLAMKERALAKLHEPEGKSSLATGHLTRWWTS
ncbi:hypothetical protein MTYM_01491 [Methylococcales bacterium]|nr:hypothetical protein MTYM_01491 [Methylococcales bacterium]